MNPRTVNTIKSSLEDEFELQVFGYYHLEDLERFYETNSIQPRRIVYDGKPQFITDALAQEIVPNDGSHILAKLETQKQDPTYMVDLEEPQPKYKDFTTDEFNLTSARDSFQSLVNSMNTPTFVLVFLKKS